MYDIFSCVRHFTPPVAPSAILHRDGCLHAVATFPCYTEVLFFKRDSYPVGFAMHAVHTQSLRSAHTVPTQCAYSARTLLWSGPTVGHCILSLPTWTRQGITFLLPSCQSSCQVCD